MYHYACVYVVYVYVYMYMWAHHVHMRWHMNHWSVLFKPEVILKVYKQYVEWHNLTNNNLG